MEEEIKANYTKKEVRYFDCPNCGNHISDEPVNCQQQEEIFVGEVISCNSCYTLITIDGEE